MRRVRRLLNLHQKDQDLADVNASAGIGTANGTQRNQQGLRSITGQQKDSKKATRIGHLNSKTSLVFRSKDPSLLEQQKLYVPGHISIQTAYQFLPFQQQKKIGAKERDNP